MIKHGMYVLHQAAEFLNPGQIPVVTLDAPLNARVQVTHSEDKFCIAFGGLHIELKCGKHMVTTWKHLLELIF